MSTGSFFLFHQRTHKRISAFTGVDRLVQSCLKFSIIFFHRTEQGVPTCVDMALRGKSFQRPFDSEPDSGGLNVHRPRSCLRAVLPSELELMERMHTQRQSSVNVRESVFMTDKAE